MMNLVQLLVAMGVLAGPGPVVPTVQSPDSVPPLEAHYSAYVVAESEDLVHRIQVGPEGATVENTVVIEELMMDIDGPTVSPWIPQASMPM